MAKTLMEIGSPWPVIKDTRNKASMRLDGFHIFD